MVLALLCYVLGSLAWLPAIKIHNHLATVGTVWSVFSLMATVLIGVCLGESLKSDQMWGIVVACSAVWLLTQ